VLSAIYSGSYFEAWGGQADAESVLQLKKDTFRQHVLNAAGLKPGARVLDCGAALGALMDAAAEAGLEPYGIEIVADAAAAIARRFGPGRVFAGPFEQAAFPELAGEEFDCVYMCDFIEHVRDPLSVLRKAATLVKRGGWLVLTTPDTNSLSCRLMGAGWPHYNVEHLYCFNRRNLTTLLARAGFTLRMSRNARKVVTLQYLRHHLNARPQPFVTPAFNLLARCAGQRLCQRQASFALGQMLLAASRD
jgi:SAM-dependent methyltransferase